MTSPTPTHVLLAALAGLGAMPATAAPQVLNFDTVASVSPPVQLFSSYGGFNWGPRWAVVNAENECGGYGCGFLDGRTSGLHVATNGFDTSGAITSPVPFRLVSIQLGSAWWNNLRISFTGMLNGTAMWSATYLVNATGSTLATFPSAMIDTLEVTPDLGVATSKPYWIGSGPRMVWDDFTFDLSPIAGVPEPASWAMLIGGFALVGAAARQRRMMLSC